MSRTREFTTLVCALLAGVLVSAVPLAAQSKADVGDAINRLIDQYGQKFYGNGSVAVASFYWYRTAVVPPGMPKDVAQNAAAAQPAALTLVLTKDGARVRARAAAGPAVATQRLVRTRSRTRRAG